MAAGMGFRGPGLGIAIGVLVVCGGASAWLYFTDPRSTQPKPAAAAPIEEKKRPAGFPNNKPAKERPALAEGPLPAPSKPGAATTTTPPAPAPEQNPTTELDERLTPRGSESASPPSADQATKLAQFVELFQGNSLPGATTRPGGATTTQPTTQPTRPPPPLAPPSSRPAPRTPGSDDPAVPRGGMPDIEAAKRRYEAGQAVEARHELNAMLGSKRTPIEQEELRKQLTKIADETIFSKKVVANDPVIESYSVQKGDNLTAIAKKVDIPYEAVMRVNGIANAKNLRVSEKLKLPRGPFNVKVYKSQFRMDIYLQDLYVRSYRVGLGAADGTPEGTWKVTERLKNPTYYPPEKSPIKKVVAADDPKNPLGERWIGLEGVEGEAVGHKGFGIHGTIEPEAIGKNMSLGCVRMHNEDVEFVYDLLQPGKSTVTILP